MSRMIIPLIAVFVLLFSNIALAEETSKDSNGFKVDWSCEDSIIDHVCYVDVYNTDLIDALFSSSDSFKSSLKFSDSSVDGIKATVYKWTDGLTKTVPLCEHVEKTCDYSEDEIKNLNLTEKDEIPKNYDCSYDDCSKTEEITYGDWKLLRDTIVFPDAKSSEKAYLDAPSLKYGEWQSYKVEYQTPIGFNNGFGSLGKIAFYEEDSKEEYHPWWNSSWARCVNLSNTTLSAVNYSDEWVEKNVTGLTFANVNELRLVDNSCGNSGNEIMYDVISSTASSALIGFYANNTTASGVVYSLYYDNAGASAPTRTSQFNVANTTYVNTSIDATVYRYTVRQATRATSVSGSWTNWNSTNHQLARSTYTGNGEGYDLWMRASAIVGGGTDTRASTYTGNLTFRMVRNATGYNESYAFYKNKMVTTHNVIPSAGMTSDLDLTLGTSSIVTVNNSTLINRTTGDVDVAGITENWTASYTNSTSYVVAQLGKNLADAQQTWRVYQGTVYQPSVEMGKYNSVYPIVNGTIIETRIIATDGTANDAIIKTRGAYYAFLNPIVMSQGAEQMNANPIAITIDFPTNNSFYAKWTWENVTLNTSASSCRARHCIVGGTCTNLTMSNDSSTHYYDNRSYTQSSQKNLTIYCNDSTNAWYNSTTLIYTAFINRSLSVNLISPQNTTLYVLWAWINSTVNDTASSCVAQVNGTNTSMVNDLCYQETANVSTGCGGLNTGAYTFAGGWTPAQDYPNTFDANWSSYGNRAGGIGTSTIYMNYTIPANATSAVWYKKDGNGDGNDTVPSSCFNKTLGKLVLEAESVIGGISNSVGWYCHNGTAWSLINNTIGSNDIYEEGVYWNMGWSLNKSLGEGSHTAKVYCNDSSFNETYASSSVSFTITLPEPIAITLDYPTNTTYYNTSAIDCNATLNTTTDGGCNCSIDGTNYSMSNDTSLTYYKTNNSVIEGSHTAQVFCKDKASIVYNSSLIYFYTIPPPESWTGYEVTNGGDTTFTDKAGNMLDKGTGNVYAVLENSSYILVEVSSDEGFNWTLLNKSNATTDNHVLSMIKDSDLIHIITFNNTSSMLRYRTFNTTDSTLSAPVNTTNATYVTSITPLYVVESVNATHDALCYAIRTPVSTNKFYPVCMYRTLASTGAFTDGTSGTGVIVSNSTSYPIFNVYKTGTQWYGMMCYANNSLKELGCNDYTVNNMTAKSSYKVNTTPAMTYVRVVAMTDADNGQLRAFFGDGVVNATDYKMKSAMFSNVSRTWGSVEIETYLPLVYNYTYKDSVTRDSDGYCHMIERASNNTTTLADDYLVYKKSSNTNCQFDQTQPEINILAYLNETNITNIKDIRAMSPSRDDRMSFIYGVNTTDIFYAELPRGLMIAVFNEETLAQINNWDLLITSPTNSSLITNISSIYSGIWTEDLAIRISKAGFYDRYYYVDMSAMTGYILNAYLLNTSDGQVVNFLVTDQQDVPLEDVHITARRNIGGVWMTMEEKDTDASGAGSMFLNPDIEYYMSFNKTGYPVYQPLLFPTLTDYVIKLGISTYTMWNSQFEGITFYRLMPVYPTYRNNTILNNEFMITSTNGTLDYWGMNITFGNTSLLYSNSSNTSTGGRMNYSHNWTNAECNTSWFYNGTCNLTVSYFFKGVNNSDIYGDSRTYYITNSTSGYSLWGAMTDITSWGVNTSYAMFMLILFIALVAGGMIAKMHGAMAGAVVAEMILFVAVYMQWMDSTVWLLSLIILGAVGMAMSDRSPD